MPSMVIMYTQMAMSRMNRAGMRILLILSIPFSTPNTTTMIVRNA